ncbi:hypothetical protein B0H14DRAFT_2612094 [Mycena olivaceomarginata]|nr:hypothetical protein B0H14DRAFT_2612094 [Mycena olivaceomarginata]
MSAVGDNNGSDNHGSDRVHRRGSPERMAQGARSAKIRPKRQVQEVGRRRRGERAGGGKRAALAEARWSPEEREERRRVERGRTDLCHSRSDCKRYEVETKRQIAEAKKTTDHDKAETVELLGRGESPDANDVPDENLDSDDESTDPDAGPKMRPASVLTPEPEEDADGEMDVDGAEEIRPEENDPEENRPEEDHPETSHSSHIQEWLAGLEPAEIAQSEDTGDMELDGPGEFGPFLATRPGSPSSFQREEPSEAEMLARSAGRKEEEGRGEDELARVEAQMAELQSKLDALAATKAVKLGAASG